MSSTEHPSAIRSQQSAPTYPLGSEPPDRSYHPVETQRNRSHGRKFRIRTGSEPVKRREKEEVKEQIKTFKKYYNLTHEGEYYRLTNPMETGFVQPVGSSYPRIRAKPGTRHADPGTAKGPSIHIPVRGLKADAMYEVNGELQEAAAP